MHVNFWKSIYSYKLLLLAIAGWSIHSQYSVMALSKQLTVNAVCFAWVNNKCPLQTSPQVLQNYEQSDHQTLCKADISVGVQQIDWISTNNGKGYISSIKVNDHEFLNAPLYPSSAFILPQYPSCDSWYSCFPPYTNAGPGAGARQSILDLARKNYVSFDVKFMWSGPHEDPKVCSTNGFSYAAVARLDYYSELQENDLCPGWNASTKTICHEHGDCLCSLNDGSPRTCACDNGWGTADCSQCDSTHFGTNCSQMCPSCLNSGKCNSGINGDGKCKCREGFDAATNCASCLPGFYGVHCTKCPDCNYPHGNCADGITGNGECACATGYDTTKMCSDCAGNFFGPECSPCDSCGSGSCVSGVKGNGTCICPENFDPKHRCSECLPGYYGPQCEKCESCHDHGYCNDTIKGDGECVCEERFTVSSRCSRCSVGWDLNTENNDCQCAPNHFGPHCRSCPICAPNGKCNDGLDGDGSCICDVGFSDSSNCIECMRGYVGATCKPCKYCGHGKCDDGLQGSGECACHVGWNSTENCLECLSGYFGSSCKSCPRPCGFGRCSSGLDGTGECICEPGFEANSSEPCTTCEPGYIGTSCLKCPGITHDGAVCSGNGVCSEVNGTASCVCDARYSGFSCNVYKFPIAMVAALGTIALATLAFCMCSMRRLAHKPKFKGPYTASDFEKSDYLQISNMSDLEFFVSADSRDWIIPFESLTLLFEVGNGTSGQVFKSLYHSGGGSSTVAVKRLYSPITGQEYFQNFFRREVSILSKLHHPNVVRFYGVSYYSRVLYIVTDFCPENLHDLIESPNSKGPFESSFFIKIATQITSGMGFLHSRNVVHRDLKPANVLLTENNDVNICDFGLSRLLDPDMTSMTAEVGTPSYMAPEMATMGGIQCSTKGDIYSFGILLYSMWTRSKPYGDQGMNPFQLMTAVVNGLRPVIPFNCPKGLADLVRSCWDANPDARPSFPEISLQLKDEYLMHIPENDEALQDRPRAKSMRKEEAVAATTTTYGTAVVVSTASTEPSRRQSEADALLGPRDHDDAAMPS